MFVFIGDVEEGEGEDSLLGPSSICHMLKACGQQMCHSSLLGSETVMMGHQLFGTLLSTCETYYSQYIGWLAHNTSVWGSQHMVLLSWV